MKTNLQKFAAVVLILILVLSCVPAIAENGGKQLTLLFTSDIHSYYEPYSAQIEGTVREHGGAGRLKALIDKYSNDHSIYLDAGDFAMGTLLHAAYTTDACELRLLGSAGCAATTFGNHEFDFGDSSAAQMLRTAMASGDPLPQLITPANLQFPQELPDAQRELKSALAEMDSRQYRIFDVDGIRVGVFSLMGNEAAMYTPTSGVSWNDPIESAKNIVSRIGNQADIIICISHSGTKGDGKSGEDFELLKKVPEVDVVVSGHSHTTYHDVITKNGAYLGSCGEYLSYLGRMELNIAPDGVVTCTDYELIPCDETVTPDAELDARVADFRAAVTESYLKSSGMNYDTVIARSDFSFMSLSDMYAIRDQYPMAELIADAYVHAYESCGIDDVDVGLVALGTIRGSITQGDITVANAFEICSLGMGSDGSAGHPILSAYVHGSDLKFLAELDAFAGGMMPSYRMNYSGLTYTFDTNRAPLDRVRDMCIVRRDGTKEPVEKNKLYRVAVNMYAFNLLGSLKTMSFGLVSLVPCNADGSPMDLDDPYAYVLKDANGHEVREWEALRDYLMSFEKVDGVPTVPAIYSEPLDRKVQTASKGLSLILHPGTSTIVLMVLGWIIIMAILLPILTRKQRRARREAKRAKRKKA